MHPTLEQMAKMLSGRMEYDELLLEIVPHLLENCGACAALVAIVRSDTPRTISGLRLLRID